MEITIKVGLLNALKPVLYVSRKPPESDPVLPNQPLFGPEMPPKAALKGAPKRKKSVKR